MSSQLFIPQEQLNQWIDEQKATMEGESITLQPDGGTYQLQGAVHIVAELTEENDPEKLIGKVFDLDRLQKEGKEYASGSLLVGDCAYETEEGFLGTQMK